MGKEGSGRGNWRGQVLKWCWDFFLLLSDIFAWHLRERQTYFWVALSDGNENDGNKKKCLFKIFSLVSR